jgi:hypothetical protein
LTSASSKTAHKLRSQEKEQKREEKRKRREEWRKVWIVHAKRLANDAVEAETDVLHSLAKLSTAPTLTLALAPVPARETDETDESDESDESEESGSALVEEWQQAGLRRGEARRALVGAMAAVRTECEMGARGEEAEGGKDGARGESAEGRGATTLRLERLRALRRLLGGEETRLSQALGPLMAACEQTRLGACPEEPGLDSVLAAGPGPAFAVRDLVHEARVMKMDRAAAAAIRGCPDPFLQGQLADELQVGRRWGWGRAWAAPYSLIVVFPGAHARIQNTGHSACGPLRPHGLQTSARLWSRVSQRRRENGQRVIIWPCDYRWSSLRMPSSRLRPA